MAKFQKPRGTQDIYGDALKYWYYIEETVRQQAALYQFQEMRTPMFESYDLFARGVGETSDIVSKEMYDFYDKGERHLALKPESTATIVRSYIENKLFAEGDYQKYYYIAPHFRYERAQAGRYRQHHQFGVEVFGDKNPYVDAETIIFAVDLLHKLGVDDFTVKINSLGDTATRIAHREALQDYFRPYLPELCADCNQRFEKNPLRILDCKKDAQHPAMSGAPKISDYLSPEAKTYMDTVLSVLKGFDIPYVYDDTLVRGLDYYTHTVFEIVLNNPSSAKAGSLSGGGRYDGLVEQAGGPAKSGIGFGMGIERLILALQEQTVVLPEKTERRVFVANLEASSQAYAMQVVWQLRQRGINVETNMQPKSMKAIFKLSDRFQATDLVILGSTEAETQTVTHKNLATREQETSTLDAFLTTITE